MTSRRTVLTAVVMTALVLLVGCGSPKGPSSASTVVRDETATDYSGPGPYPVGVRVLEVGGARAWIWYPARTSGTSTYDTAEALPVSIRAFVPTSFHASIDVPADGDAPVAKRGSFPVVLHSHGFAGFPEFESLQLAHLASWGFVVIAPDHTGRNLSAILEGEMQIDDHDVEDLAAALDRVRVENEGGFLRGRADLSRVATEGHSAGGAAAIEMARDARVATFIGLAPAAPVPFSAATMSDPVAIAQALAAQTPPDKPGLLLGGAADGVVLPSEVDAIYRWMSAPKTKVMVAGMGHNGFTDLCDPIREMGGLGSIGAGFLPAAFLTLADDGCGAGNLDPARGRAVEGQVTVAQLKWVFGTGSAESLSQAWLDRLFPGAIASVESVG